MTFTREQMQILAQWESNFGTAVRSNWARGIGRSATAQLHRIYTEATGDRRTLNASCGTCVLRLLKDAGRLYFADKEEMIALMNDKVAADLTEEKPKRRRKSNAV